MNPRLMCLAGPREGTQFALDACVTIGRVATNQIGLLDGAVSRRHCKIEPIGDAFELTDLDSRNGTFVNGVPVTSRLLEHGDQIGVGASVFLFLLHEQVPDKQVSSDIEMSDSGYVLSVTQDFSRRPVNDRTAADLRAVLKLNSALASVSGLEALEQKLLESLAEMTPADRGAIILVGANPDELTSLFGWDKYPREERPVNVSRPAIDRALHERTAFIASAETAGIASLLVVPLIVLDRLVGAIYLDTAHPPAFDASHLELVAGCGPIAAVALENARRWQWLKDENTLLQAESSAGRNLIGESAAMKDVRQFVAKVAPSDSTVLIGGESGTGKELVARAIHAQSGRAERPFVAVNCAALTESLLESEMFGHEKGAFTGAIAMKKGKLEAADGGTFFLDEVGELSGTLQAKLLRVLQEREFERVGGTRTIKLNVRLIAATNRNLKDAVKEKTFREDLYYRLNVVSVTLPPLRERRADVSLLATYFLAKHREQSKSPLLGISPEARACLQSYDWPGNVRELQNAIERAVVMRSGDVILPEDLPDALLEAGLPAFSEASGNYHASVLETKKRLILAALHSAGGNYTEAAKTLGVHVNYLHRLIRNMNLKSAIESQS